MDYTEVAKVARETQEAEKELKAMGVEEDVLGCHCVNHHKWFTFGHVPDTLAVVQRANTAKDFDPNEFDTRFYDPNGRWCPQCGEPDTYCVETFALEKRDPAEVREMYAVVADLGGTYYVDRRMNAAAAQEN